MYTIDFETKAIQPRPEYPPKPVGVAIKHNADKAHYWAFGHPTGNNCNEAWARQQLRKAWNSREELLFHNGKFDVDVAETHWELRRLPWERLHDTMFLAFLNNPHARDLGLKPLAEELLGIPPDERDEVREWLVAHGIINRALKKKWGAFISEAPGDLVGKYARGDVDRTFKLFKKLMPIIVRRGMEKAYNRERRLMPILLSNEREGISVATRKLHDDIVQYIECIELADKWLQRRLRSKDLNLDSDEEVAEALSRNKIIADSDWVLTARGQRSVSKKNLLPAMFSDAKVASVLGYRSRLQTCLSTFAIPWYTMAVDNGDRICTTWNQVRGAEYGTRTGRPSSTAPNFLNVPKSFDDKDDGFVHPSFIKELMPLPLMRRYMLPDKGGVWVHRDFNQQELRILGHYEDDALCVAYNENPKLDVHDFVRMAIKELLGLDLHRPYVKTLNFGFVYGMGMNALVAKLRMELEEVKKLRNAQMNAVPGLKDLADTIKETAKAGEPIITWGGRQYFPEEPKYIGGRLVEFIYKLLNYLIQGSAADATKEALIRYDEARQHGRFLVTVYDEINVSAPKAHYKKEMEILKDCMQGLEFDVPMLSDGKVGPTWGDQKTYDKFGEIV